MNAYATHLVSYLLAQSWQIAILAAVVGLISFALRNRSAHLRYLLWLIVLAKCLVPPFLTVPLAVLPGSSSRPSVTLIDLPEERYARKTPVFVGGSPEPHESAPAVPSAREWIALVWTAGTFSFLLWVGGRAVRYTSWLRDRRRPLPPVLQESIEELSMGFKFRKWPRLWLVEDISQPFVWGLLRGSVYLPADFVGLNGSDQQRSILAHELSHVARFDAGVNLLQVLAQAVYWFHPLVWWANRKIRQEREKCCDEMALAHLNTPPEHYTGAIVDALAAERRSAHPIPSLAIVGSVRDIEERIKTMLKPGKTFHRRPSIVAAAVASLIALVTIPTALVLTAGGQTPVTAQSTVTPAVAVEKTEQPRYAARTFNSDVAFEVFVMEAPSGMRSIGHTPSAAPLEIPACRFWLVRPVTPVKDWDLLVWEIDRNHVPRLSLDSATDAELEHLANLTSLAGLDLGSSQITDAGMEHLRGLTGLCWLGLSKTAVTGAGLAHLKGMTALQELELQDTRIVDASLSHLKNLTELWGLDLSNTPITDAGMEHLRDSDGLRDLYLDGTAVTDAGLAHLRNLTRLHYLNLGGTHVTSAGLANLKGLTEPRGLYLAHTQVTDAGLAHLKGLTVLRTLDLSGTQITDAGLEHLKGLTELRRLNLSETAITGAGLAQFKGLLQLQTLLLARTQVTDAGLEYLKALTGLQGLDLSGAPIRDAGLEHLEALSGLQTLEVGSTQITDAGLADLRGLTKLQQLNLSGTQVTGAGIRQLKQSLPKLTVVRGEEPSRAQSTDRPAQSISTLAGSVFTDNFDNGPSNQWRLADLKKEELPVPGHAGENGQLMLSNAMASLDSIDWTDYIVKVRVCVKESVASGEGTFGFGARKTPSNFGLTTTDSYALAILCQDSEPRGVVLGFVYYDASKIIQKDIMAVTGCPMARDQWYTLEFEVRGENLRGYLDGKLVIEGTDTRLSKGSVGLTAWRTRVLIDDFSVRRLP